MNLEIITPDKSVFKGEVSSVTLTGVGGQFQIWKDHAPMVSTLAANGDLTYQTTAGTQTIVVDGGVVEILNNKVLVLAEAVV